jgi:serine/threonine protein kinase
MPVRAGDILAGKYRVVKVLGAGGMGMVVEARHLQLEQRVALKFLLPEALKTPDVVARFTREARAAATITSRHAVRVLDIGSLETGVPYIVMEFLEGKDLADVLASRGPLPIAEAVDYILQACEALAEAHAAQIVHRDIKPANLFLARQADGSSIVKVIDFGISKVTGSTESGGLTTTSTLLGSPFYMSPEQLWSARTVDARSDVWSLGVALFELLTRETPFGAPTMPQLVAEILGKPPRSAVTLRPDLPRALETVILRCLEKEPQKRYRDVSELAAALVPFGSESAAALAARVSRVLGAIHPLAETVSERTVETTSQDPSWGRTAREQTRSRTRLVAALGAGVAGMALAGAVLLFLGQGERRGAPGAPLAPVPSISAVMASSTALVVPSASSSAAASASSVRAEVDASVAIDAPDAAPAPTAKPRLPDAPAKRNPLRPQLK